MEHVMSVLPARRRVLAAVVTGIAATVVLPATAFAHVTVQPDSAQPGTYTREAFRVPNERDDAATVQIEVTLPADHPLASVSVQQIPGWTATVRKEKLATPLKSDDGEVTEAVSSITWSGGSIGPGQFQEFPVSLGPLPDGTNKLFFKALQTYSDGQVVRWIEVPQDGAPSPEHPAPTLTVASAAAPAVASDSSNIMALMLGGAGLLAGLAALGVALAHRRPSNAVSPKPATGAKEKVRA
jgi:uncharacterized protein YcnI